MFLGSPVLDISENLNEPPAQSGGFDFPAAVGGLNRRDAKAKMPKTDANILMNVEPRPNFCVVRRGYESYATGLGAAVETLMEWAGATRQFFAAAGTTIWDITSAGAASADVTGLTNARWHHTMFKTAGGSFLVACNGADSVRNYDGTSWTTPAITGVTSADLIYVAAWKNRLWFVEKNTTNAWYLPVNSIAGAATRLDLGAQFKRGGFLNTIGTLSYDAGDGPDDFIAFVSDQGDVAVYQGTDPSSASTFAIMNRFTLGAPIGRRSLLNVGGDLAMISVDGIVSLISMSDKDRSVAESAAITNKIQDLFNQYARDYRGIFGWQGQIYPLGSIVYFNVPFSSTQSVQLVMNVDTGAWAEFQNMNGACWGLYNDQPYFGGANGVVYRADSGLQDNGGIITFDYQSAFSQFGHAGKTKLYQLIRPILLTNGSPTILMSMNTNFSDVEPTGTLSPSAPATSTWDSGVWDSAQWGGTNTSAQWYSVGQEGEWGAVRMKGALNGISLQINAFTIEAEVGGAL